LVGATALFVFLKVLKSCFSYLWRVGFGLGFISI